jgi:hypothetical protein
LVFHGSGKRQAVPIGWRHGPAFLLIQFYFRMFYKVVVIHGGNTEPMVTCKEIFDAANNLYMSECRNAAGYLTNKPGHSITVQLFKPDGTVDKQLSVTAHLV